MCVSQLVDQQHTSGAEPPPGPSGSLICRASVFRLQLFYVIGAHVSVVQPAGRLLLPTPTVPSLSATDVSFRRPIRTDAPSRPPQATERHVKGGTVGRGTAGLIGRLRVMERC